MRGRKLLYSGDLRTRPMKDRVRQTVFDLLADRVRGKHAIDLFAGTGALGLEALSRGALRATLLEQHLPTARLLRENVASLRVDPLCEVVCANTFVWFARGPDLGPDPWAVFCSPPYDFYVRREAEMLELIRGLVEAAPPGSLLVVESDRRFDFARLAGAGSWEVRTYPPAVIGIAAKQPAG